MKIAIPAKELTFSAYKCKRPKMSTHRGRVWDTWTYDVTLNGAPIDLWFEAGYGSSFYFRYAGEWYRAPWWNAGIPRTQNLIPEDITAKTMLKIVEKKTKE